jgi:hypothetical protein
MSRVIVGTLLAVYCGQTTSRITDRAGVVHQHCVRVLGPDDLSAAFRDICPYCIPYSSELELEIGLGFGLCRKEITLDVGSEDKSLCLIKIGGTDIAARQRNCVSVQ